MDYIIVGEGICGTFLSWNLLNAGKKIMVIDEPQKFSSTKVASGIINPVTGRRVVTTWMIEELLLFAGKAYEAIGNDIGKTIIEQKNTVAFPASPQMLETYNKRANESHTFVQRLEDGEIQLREYFNFAFPAYTINPTYLIYLHPLLNTWRKKLIESNSLAEEKFEDAHLAVYKDYVEYKNLKAGKIIFCNGANTFQSMYWRNLPYVFNKGQALIADIPNLPANAIYKYGSVTLAPWYHDLWWVGSSYENDFDTTDPTESFYNSTATSLKSILKIPFSIKDHLAALRPAVIERRPVIGLHPNYPSVGIFNGMGTKGCSLAPYFANQLTAHLVNNDPLDPLADVKRFHRLLSK
jgi:glycine/D-amino acid oxidase-like deaminating enzyme